MSGRALKVKKRMWRMTPGCTFVVVSLRISYRPVAVEICGSVFLPLGLRNGSLEKSLEMEQGYLATCRIRAGPAYQKQ